MTLRELQDAVSVWQLKNFGEHPGWHPLLGIVEEVGELSHAHLKKVQNIRLNEDHDANKRDAIGDILIYLADYCNQEHIDMQQCMEITWAGVRQRDWTKNKEKGI